MKMNELGTPASVAVGFPKVENSRGHPASFLEYQGIFSFNSPIPGRRVLPVSIPLSPVGETSGLDSPSVGERRACHGENRVTVGGCPRLSCPLIPLVESEFSPEQRWWTSVLHRAMQRKKPRGRRGLAKASACHEAKENTRVQSTRVLGWDSDERYSPGSPSRRERQGLTYILKGGVNRF